MAIINYKVVVSKVVLFLTDGSRILLFNLLKRVGMDLKEIVGLSFWGAEWMQA